MYKFSKYSLNNNYVPGTVPYIGKIVEEKANKVPAQGVKFQWEKNTVSIENYIYINFG